MPDPKHEQPVERIAWATLTAKVHELESKVKELEAALPTIVGACQQRIDALVMQVQPNIDIIYHLIRMSRGESMEQFRLTLTRAQMEMNQPPEADAIAQLRSAMERQSAEIERLKGMLASHQAQPVSNPEVEPEKPKRQRAAKASVNEPTVPVVERNLPDPSVYAPANVVAPPPFKDRPTPASLVPATARFGEGR